MVPDLLLTIKPNRVNILNATNIETCNVCGSTSFTIGAYLADKVTICRSCVIPRALESNTINSEGQIDELSRAGQSSVPRAGW